MHSTSKLDRALVFAVLALAAALVGLSFGIAFGGTDLPMHPVKFGDPAPVESEVVPEPVPEPPPEELEEDPRDLPAPVFYSEEITVHGPGIVYVLDASTSMTWSGGNGPSVQWKDGVGSELGNFQRRDGTWDRPLLRHPNGNPKTISRGWPWHRAQAETIESIQGLAENFRFNVYTFTCAPRPLWPGLLEATPGNKAAAVTWLYRQRPGGGTGTGQATASALTHKDADTVVLLTDGAPGCNTSETPAYHRRMINTANTQRAAVHVFGLRLDADTRGWCQRVAADSAGGRFVELP